LSPLEESLGVSPKPVARLPKWVRELSVGVSTDKSIQASVITKRKIQALVKVYPVYGESNSGFGEDFPSSGEAFHFELWSCGL